jgi:hypothetical protein
MPMMNAVVTPSMRDGLSSPLSSKSFLLVVLVLTMALVAVDVEFNGPLTFSAAQLLVVRPAERDWGFHAEERAYGSPNAPGWLLTVVQVTPGGAFDQAGITPGVAFAPPLSGFGEPRFGGRYSVFSGGRKVVRIRMVRKPNESWKWETLEISRK